jgi:HEAT repeat protein
MRRRKLERLVRNTNVPALSQIVASPEYERAPDRTLLDKNSEARQSAIDALAQIDGPEADEAIARALHDPISSVRSAAIRALGDRGTESSLGALAYACATWSDEADRGRHAALERLTQGPNPTVARRYVDGLLGTDSSFPPDDLDERLIRGLVGGDPELVERLVSELVEELGSRDGERATRAGTVLCWLGQPAVRAVEDVAHGVQGAGGEAARVLGEMGEEASLGALTEVLQRGSTAHDRRHAAVAMAQLRTPLAIEPLLRATRDPDRSVRDAALSGLDSYGTMATVALIGDVIRPGLDAPPGARHTELDPVARPHPSPLEPSAQTGSWRRVIRGLLAGGD